MSVDQAPHPAPQVHEIRANLTYDEHGDSPYWALRNIYDKFDGATDGIEIEIDGELWTISANFHRSGLDPRKTDEVEKLYEYRVNAYGDGQRKLPLLIQPRLDWSDDRRPKSVPKDLGLATNIKLETATNLSPEEIETLIPKVVEAVAREAETSWNTDYFTGTPHEYSTITAYELYYRILRGEAKKLVRSDGLFHRLFHLLADVEGSKIVYSADNTDILGHNHQIRMSQENANRLLEGIQHGKQLKLYYPEHVNSDDEDPLYYPKFGALFKKGLNRGGIRWHDRRELERELEENLINCLRWAGIPTRKGPTYISDDHFDASVSSDREVALFEDPTPDIDHDQDSVLVSTLTRLSDRDLDVLEVVADGGNAHVAELETETEYATSTIYRAIDRLGELLQNENGNVSFISEKIRQRVVEVVERTQEIVDVQASIIEDVLNIDERDLERAGRAWQQWLHTYGAEVLDNGGEGDDTTIRIRTVMSRLKSDSGEYAPEVIGKGATAWHKAGRDPRDFENAIIQFDSPTGIKTVIAKRLLREYTPPR